MSPGTLPGMPEPGVATPGHFPRLLRAKPHVSLASGWERRKSPTYFIMSLEVDGADSARPSQGAPGETHLLRTTAGHGATWRGRD